MKNLILTLSLVIFTLFSAQSILANDSLYIVVQNDSLWKISEKLNVNSKTLYKLNEAIIGDNPDLIYPGQKFTIPPIMAKITDKATTSPELPKPSHKIQIADKGKALHQPSPPIIQAKPKTNSTIEQNLTTRIPDTNKASPNKGLFEIGNYGLRPLDMIIVCSAFFATFSGIYLVLTWLLSQLSLIWSAYTTFASNLNYENIECQDCDRNIYVKSILFNDYILYHMYFKDRVVTSDLDYLAEVICEEYGHEYFKFLQFHTDPNSSSIEKKFKAQKGTIQDLDLVSQRLLVSLIRKKLKAASGLIGLCNLTIRPINSWG